MPRRKVNQTLRFAPMRTYLPVDHMNDSQTMGETNDCAVFAVAALAGITYREAHAALAREGRRPRKGTPRTMTVNALRKLGYIVSPLETSEKIAIQKKYQRRPTRGLTSMQIASFPDVFEGKNLLVGIKGHVFAVVNGKLNDTIAPNKRPSTTLHHVVKI